MTDLELLGESAVAGRDAEEDAIEALECAWILKHLVLVRLRRSTHFLKDLLGQGLWQPEHDD